MKIIKLRYLATALAMTMALAACQNSSLPTSANGNWINLGVSASGNVQYALDSGSIKRQNNLVTFRDRKTVIDPKQQYYNNTPSYKSAISTMQIDCGRKVFRILDVQLLDARGEVIRQDHFNDTDLRPMSVTNGSAAEQQFKQVCNH